MRGKEADAVLSGSLVRLRPVREEDVDWLVEESGKPAGLGEFEPFTFGRSEMLRWEFQESRLLSSDNTRLIIEERSGGRRIGVAAIEELEWHSRTARIRATILDPHERGKGFGTDAHRLLVSYLFRHLGLVRIEAFVAAGNLAAQSVLRKLGFQEEGRLRARLFAHGQRHDILVFGLLLDEHKNQSGREIILI